LFFSERRLYIVDMPAKRKKSRPLVRVISSKTSFRGPVFSVMTDEVEEPGNVRARRDVIRHSGSIVVLPLDDSGRTPLVLLERQYRYAAGRRMWELPAGRVDPGENHLAAAKRELMEETGYTASRWQKALFFYVSPGFLDESMTVYLASGLKKGIAQPEEDERIAVRFFSLQQAVRMAVSGKIIDAKTIASLFWLEKKLTKIK
jgi:ADP-ribose pyrophosphatase